MRNSRRALPVVSTIFLRGGWRNLDSTAPSRSLPWNSLRGYVENDMRLTTQCDDVSPRHRRWLHECNQVGHTGTLLREGSYGSRVESSPHIPFVLVQIEIIWSMWRNRKSGISQGIISAPYLSG